MTKDWQNHPRLKSYIHPKYPTDLQVLIHEGSPYLTSKQPELVWVTITGLDGNVFTGRLLNKPYELTHLQQGDIICFIVPESSTHPLFITSKYLRERPYWQIHPCQS